MEYIGTIVIGHNPGQKQEIGLGKVTNQNFVSLPEYLLRKMIKYKGEEIGISIVEQEESHTSKCSFLDEEPIGHSGKYMGKRISRGLFRSSIGPRRIQYNQKSNSESLREVSSIEVRRDRGCRAAPN